MNERLFMIIDESNGKMVLKGYVKSNTYPSRLTNDHDYSEQEFGVRYPKIVEIKEHCHINLI